MSLRIQTNIIQQQKRLHATAFVACVASLVLLYICLQVLVLSVYAAPVDEFVTTWKTDNPGTSNSSSITIPTTGGGYNYDVDWNNDGTFDEFGITGDVTHNFGAPGTYTIRIRGAFPQIHFANYLSDHQKIIDINQWGTGQWRSMLLAFAGCINLKNLSATDTPNLNGVTEIGGMFENASSFNTPINDWDVSNVTSMGNMFRNASSFNQPLNSWDVSNVTTIDGMFMGAAAFNQPLDNWNTSNIYSMQSMFYDASSFNQPLNSWDVSNAISIRAMFRGATIFDQPLDTWDTSKVTDVAYLFWRASSFNQPLATWNTSNVTDMAGTFYDATSFNQPLNAWDTSNVTKMNSMFDGASTFNQPLDTWDTSNVTKMFYMFEYASTFNQPLNTWDTSNVDDMEGMFDGAKAFNQSLAAFDVSQVEYFDRLLSDSGLSRQNYDATLLSWAVQPLQGAMTLGADGLQYCTAQSSRQSIIDTYSWEIDGDKYDCSAIPENPENHTGSGSDEDSNGTIRGHSVVGAPNSGGGVALDIDIRHFVAIIVATAVFCSYYRKRQRWRV